MNQKFVSLLFIMTALSVVGIAKADSHTAAESGLTETRPSLANSRCSDSEQIRESCLSFIKGFLKGALLTDAAIIKSVELELPKLSFSDRAKRTRLGSRLSTPTELAGFCLPEGETIRQIAESILEHTDESESNSKELAKNVYDTLKKDYPC